MALPNKITSNSKAKLNLFLHITGKREDGYHELQSLMVFTNLCDVISFTNSDSIGLSISGRYRQALLSENTSDNLAIRAANALNSYCSSHYGADIDIEKNIPLGGGLAGGSGNAAQTLLQLNVLWKLGLSHKELEQIGLSLGADIPVCLHQRPMIVGGIGNKLQSIPDFPELDILIINPGINLPTPKVYKYNNHPRTGAVDLSNQRWDKESVFELLQNTQNDLIPAAMAIAPEIENILSTIKYQPDCIISRMSGSGSTCFGIFPNKQSAHSAEYSIQKHNPNWFCKVVKTTTV